jgi:hypothetical protein
MPSLRCVCCESDDLGLRVFRFLIPVIGCSRRGKSGACQRQLFTHLLYFNACVRRAYALVSKEASPNALLPDLPGY